MKSKETLEEKLRRVTSELVSVVPYDARWPAVFKEEKAHHLSCLPAHLIRRIEHFGSTAVPGMPAKPIVDMLVEVTDLAETQRRVVPILEDQGYEYFWRPTAGEDTPPYYAWFIKRDALGHRTHHIHMVEEHFELWQRLLFRDYLIEFAQVAQDYGALKQQLAESAGRDRIAYTRAKASSSRE